ncbi:SRPBCC family protein [Janibacter terrae]|uniref:SRPBCC family protein n=1 Tax=Janibacter terrae TaxID=103817 RepID=UPI00082B7BFE|nr:SRPBCC family protein [Janibacter terrae]
MAPMGRSGLLGEVWVADGVPVVHVEDVYDTDIDDLWDAITEPARLGRWVASVEGDLRPGGLFRASFTSGWDGGGRVEVCEAPHRLLLTMEPGAADETTIEAVLSAQGGGTRLVVEERGIPVEQAPDHGAGWQAHLEDLRAVLDGRVPGSWSQRWAALRPAYAPVQRP